MITSELIRVAPTMLRHLTDRPLNPAVPHGAGAGLLADIPIVVGDPLARDRRRRPRPPGQRPPAGRPRDATWLGNQASFEIHA
jgi:hypothetical protein